MLKLKALLSNILSWVNGWGVKRIERAVNNTTDTWVPVFASSNGDNVIQHRVLPSVANTTATKVGSYWTNGTIYVYRAEHVIWVKFDNITTTNTNRQNWGRIPEGYRPPRETYDYGNGIGITYDGYVWSNAKLTGYYNAACYIQMN